MSVHRLRAAYARIAIHYWLPGQGVNEQRWLQFYLGHVSAGEMRDAANSNSASHYFGYCLVDDQGKPITVTGIKLMANPLPSLTEQQLQQQQSANDRLSLRDEAQRRSDRFAQPPEADRLDSDTTEPDFTPQEEAVMSPTQHEVQEVAANLQTLPEKEPQPTSTPAQPIVFEPTAHQPKQPKRSKPRYRELRVNLADLSAAADRLGIDTTSRTGYQALLDRLLLAIPSALTQQVTPDPNQLLAPLLQELAAIKQQVSVGQQAEELEQLRQQTEQQHEIDRLHTELQSAHDRLAQIAAAAQGLAGIQPTPVSQPTPAQQSIAPVPHTPISQPPVQQPAPMPRPAPGRPSFGKLSPSDRVPIAITALMHHNQNCPPDDRWFLSGNVIATAASANPALVVTPWLQSHPAATAQIDHHNAAIGLNARSNGKDKDRSQLKPIYQQFIADKSPQELHHIIHQFEQQPDAII